MNGIKVVFTALNDFVLTPEVRALFHDCKKVAE